MSWFECKGDGRLGLGGNRWKKVKSMTFPLKVISPTLITNHSHRRSHCFSQPTLLIVLLIDLSHTTSFLIVSLLSFLSPHHLFVIIVVR